jgi:glutamate/tyrosine decarboxylase-like PLP-dependent enzyme
MNELYSNFIGAKGENIEVLKKLLNNVLDFHSKWRKEFYQEDESLYPNQKIKTDKLEIELQKFLERSSKQLPYFHPRYIAQMLKDPSIPTILGYLTFMLSNPNNHAYEGGPITTDMELEVIAMIKKMIGYKDGWGHLSSGGSLANLEALWAVRDTIKEGTVYFSEVSHYSWKRICKVLNIEKFTEIPVDKYFRMDLNSLEKEIQKEKPMMVMANLGSTGSGSVDDIEGVIELKKKFGFHLHIDAAYGGFIGSVILNENDHIIPYEKMDFLSQFTYNQLLALQHSDSITIDPHKQGLISYGAGAVLFKDEKLRDVILNTAPYTYHKLDKPNIGMFSLEGSRPGAMAAACYLTYKVLPLNKSGVGKIVLEALKSSQKFYDLIEQSANYINLNRPDLDINCFFRKTDKTISESNKGTLNIYKQLSVEAENPEFILSKFVIPSSIIKRILPEYSNPTNENFNSLRIVFMKHWSAMNDFYYVKKLVEKLESM